MKTFTHKNLASGRWYELSLAEQLSNIGSEINRAKKWLSKDKLCYEKSVERALELFDLTLEDPRWRHRLREIGRLRELFCDVVTGGREYNSTLANLEKKLFCFAFLSRRQYEK
jgi:hypothetical protein